MLLAVAAVFGFDVMFDMRRFVPEFLYGINSVVVLIISVLLLIANSYKKSDNK